MSVTIITRNSYSKVAGASYSDEYLAVLAEWTTDPDTTNKGYQSTLVDSLKTAGVWALADLIYVPAIHTDDAGEAKVNWHSPGDYTLTAPVASPTFTAYQGFRANGTTQYLSTTYDCATNGVNIGQDSLTLSIYLRDDTAVSDGVAIGTFNWSPYVETALYPYITYIGSNFGGKINNDQDSPLTYGPGSNSYGLFTLTRRGGTEVEGYKNDTSVTTSNTTTASLGESAVDLMIFAADNGFGTIVSYLANQASFIYVGGALSDTQVHDMYDAVQAYMTSVGYQV